MELNAWLMDQIIRYAKTHRHPELRDQTILEAFEAERPSLVACAGRFDGFDAVPASVSKTCAVRFDNNNYSVSASAVGRRSRSAPMPSGSSFARTVGSSASTVAPSDAIRQFTIPGTTCRSWRASLGRSAMARRSRTGSCEPVWRVSGASSPLPMTAISRRSTSVPPC